MSADDTLVVVDLFCGAGGFSTGAALALEELGRTPGEDVELHAINHWDVAIETHEQNHPWAEHYHSGIDDVDPLVIAEPGVVKLLVGGPECTHHSNARGGKPVSDQKREPAWNVLTWVQKLRPENVLIENVQEFTNWGPIDDETGQSTNDASVFDAWVNALNALGYAVDHRVLTCADYGDPTTRKRLFIVARRNDAPSFPAPTHSPDPDPDDGLDDWRPAADIIDWSDRGTSLWSRDADEPRLQPLKFTTMRRIAEGIRRHCDDRLEPLADSMDWIGRTTVADVEKHGIDPADFTSVQDLREEAVPLAEAAEVAKERDGPFLVEGPRCHVLTDAQILGQQSNAVARDAEEEPAPTVATAGKIHLVEPEAFCLRQQSGGVPSPVDDPLPTVAKGGAIGLAEVDGRPLIMPKNGSSGDLHSNALYPPEERPVHTITTDPRAKLLSTRLVCPFIDDYEGPPKHPSHPIGAITTRDRFALCVPEAWPWGLDVRYRMLKSSELKQAQGFPADYELAGPSQDDIKEQIGNAVPVHTAKALCKHLLDEAEPSLSNYGGGLAEDPEYEPPTYAEVAQSDD